MDRVNILLVDDRADGLLALATVLDDPEYNLVQVNSGREALKEVLQQDFALILLDVQMPEMDGFETARIIRQRERSKTTPIIFITAISTEAGRVYEGYESGAVDYLFKPFDPFILRAKVAVFVDLYRKNCLVRNQAEIIRMNEKREKERLVANLEVDKLKSLQKLSDSIPHIVWKFDPTGHLTHVNRTWTAYSGLSMEESAGTGWQRAIHPDDIETVMTAMRHADETEDRETECECRIRGKADSNYRWHILMIRPECEDDLLVGWICTCTDIHDRKTAEEQLLGKARALENSNRELEQFAYVASHDLQEPLRNIVTFGDLLKIYGENKLEAKELEAIQKMQSSSFRMSQLINGILQFSRVAQCDSPLQNIDLNTVLHEVLSDMETRISESRAHFEIDDLPVVKAKKYQMNQLFQNLVSNAIKFSKKEEAPFVRISGERKNGDLEIRVEDHGIGFEQKYVEQIFKPFKRLGSSSEYEGAGIGLAVCQKIAEEYGGGITAESEPGKGAVFTVSLPGAMVASQEKAGSPGRRTS